MATAPFGPRHFSAAEGSGFVSVALMELDGTTPVTTYDENGDTAPISVSRLGYVSFWVETGTYELQFTRDDEDDVIVETITVTPPTPPDSEPPGLSSSTLTTLDARYLLSDGGSTQTWIGSTPAAKGSVWSYNGVIYERVTDGTGSNVDSSFVRANWTAIGADPSTIGGGELAATLMATSYSSTFTANQSKDLTGMTASPIIPSNGRGIYVDFTFCATSSVANNAVSFYLFDVTAGAVATTDTYVLVQPLANNGYTLTARWRLNPPAGPRTYKVQITAKLAATIGVIGQDIGFGGLMTITAR